MGLLDSLFAGNVGTGGLLDALLKTGLMPSDQAQYGQPPQQYAQAAPQAMAQMQPTAAPMQQAAPMAPPQANAQPMAQQPAPIFQAQPQMAAPQPQQPQPQQPQPFQIHRPNPLLGNDDSFLNRLMGNDPATQALAQQQQKDNLTRRWLAQRGFDPTSIEAATSNPEVYKTLTQQPMNLGNGQVLFPGSKTATKLYEPDDKTPTSVLEYKYYRDNLPSGEKPMPYDVWSTAKSRAGATNISNNIDMNSGQTYDKQLAEGLGKSHAALANGVEDAQTRARDIAAMQGAVDSIQKSGNKTGGLGQTQMLDLKKTINAGASALGMEPFSEADIADKEFLTKFNRSMAGAQAKNAVGARVTNFEMGNFLKSNPGLDMSNTGNQRLLGIQAQIEQRNIAVGNAIRDATAEAISQGRKIDPVTVQKIVSSYDQDHHIKDVVTGQDLTQSVALPEFQGGANTPAAATHGSNITNLKSKYGLK